MEMEKGQKYPYDLTLSCIHFFWFKMSPPLFLLLKIFLDLMIADSTYWAYVFVVLSFFFWFMSPASCYFTTIRTSRYKDLCCNIAHTLDPVFIRSSFYFG